MASCDRSEPRLRSRSVQLLDLVLGKSCRLCRRRGITTVGRVSPTHPAAFQTTDFELRHCPGCGVVYLDPLPTAGDLKLLYEDSVQFSDAHYTDPQQVEKILDYYATTVRNHGLLPGHNGRVLEVGAGLAWVSRACKVMRPEVGTVAQDVSNECATRCTWVDHYFVGALESLPAWGPFDLISLTHVIEHLADPEAMLRLVASLLSTGGKALITAPFRPPGWTPDKGIEPWRKYSYLHVPAHITYFSKKWFAHTLPGLGLGIVHWDAGHEDGQAFELVVGKH